MKKNLRIVSAAAAALLAVAPVAAAAVVSPATTSVAHADANEQGVVDKNTTLFYKNGTGVAGQSPVTKAIQMSFDKVAVAAKDNATGHDLYAVPGTNYYVVKSGVTLDGVTAPSELNNVVGNFDKATDVNQTVATANDDAPSNAKLPAATKDQSINDYINNTLAGVSLNPNDFPVIKDENGKTIASAQVPKLDTTNVKIIDKKTGLPVSGKIDPNDDVATVEVPFKNTGANPMNVMVGGKLVTVAGGNSLTITYQFGLNGQNSGSTTPVNPSKPGQSTNNGSTTVAGETEASKSYFATDKGDVLANDQVVSASVLNSPSETYDKSGNRVVPIKNLKAAIEKVLGESKFYKSNASHKAYSVEQGFKNYVFGPSNATSDENIKSQLRHVGFSLTTDAKGNESYVPNEKQYVVTVRSNGGMMVHIVFQNTNHIDMDKPAIVYNANGVWTPITSNNGYVSPIILMQDDKGKFNPTDYIRAWENYDKHAFINATYTDSNVDTTKSGIYYITVSAKNAKGETTVAKVPVIVTDRNGKLMTAINDADIFTKNGQGKMVQANLANFQKFFKGVSVPVYGTETVDGVQYYHVFTPNGNYYVKASDLKDGVTTPANTNVQAKTIKIMHISTIYDKNGKATTAPALRAYDTYSAIPAKINGASFYQLVENGKPVEKYIKAGNVDGTQRNLKHNSYVYKSNGKAYMKSKKHHEVLKNGAQVTTYGKSFMIHGSQMYRIGQNRYVKKANFR